MFEDTPTYYGVPYKEATSINTYKFIGWQVGEDVYTTLPKITTNTTFVALFEEEYLKYDICFNNEYGLKIKEIKVPYGTVLSSDFIPVKEANMQYQYKFIGWSYDGEVYTSKNMPIVKENMVLKAVFEEIVLKYSVTINYLVNNVVNNIVVLNYEYGDSFAIKTPVLEGYVADRYTINGIVTDNLEFDVNYQNGTPWDGTVAESFAGGTGVFEDPYLITSPAELAYLAQLANTGSTGVDNAYGVGVYYKLVNNINLNNISWTPISYAGGSSFSWKYFGGNFDGNNKVISGIYFNNIAKFGIGLFGGISGEVKNLTIEGDITSKHRSGGLAYYLNGGTILNIISRVNVITTSETSDGCYTGGLFGTAGGNATIKNCINYGIVSGIQRYVGGISGKISSGIIDNCINYGNILGKNNTYSNYIAGITGESQSPISNCINYGYITGKSCVAGIVGRIYQQLSNCENHGIINATSTYCGGIAGHAYNDVLNCTNYADVYSSSTSHGGVIGRLNINESAPKDNKMSNCINYGNVYNTARSENALCGGVIGHVARSSVDGTVYNFYVEEVVNYGDVYCEANYVGGVAGSTNGGIILYSKNYGYVFADSATYVAGIAGSNYGYGAVNYCTNYGIIYGGGTYGQIHGQLTSTSTEIGNVYEGQVK